MHSEPTRSESGPKLGVVAGDGFAVRAMQDVGRLFAGSDAWLAVMGSDGQVVRTICSDRAGSRLDDLFSAAMVEQIRAVLVDETRLASDEVWVVDGDTIDGERVEVRVVRSRSEYDQHFVSVRSHPHSDDRARRRVRELRAALQAVADIVVPIEELDGHEEARRRATLVAPLTERERRVALAVADGVRTSQIANDLFVSQSTVRNYLPIIYRKLGVHSRAELVELLSAGD